MTTAHRVITVVGCLFAAFHLFRLLTSGSYLKSFQKHDTSWDYSKSFHRHNTSNKHPARVRFVPFPHNNLGFGSDASCNWTVIDYRNTNDSMLQSLLGSSQDSTSSIQAPPDSIQRGSLQDGICIPRNKTAASKLHLFSTQEAKACLYNVDLLIAGDSYNMQLFIGLVDILTSSVSSREIPGWIKRRKILAEERVVSTS
jgi:hypothetical protein